MPCDIVLVNGLTESEEFWASDGSTGEDIVLCKPGWCEGWRRLSVEAFHGLLRRGASSCLGWADGVTRTEGWYDELEYIRGVLGLPGSTKLTCESRRDVEP